MNFNDNEDPIDLSQINLIDMMAESGNSPDVAGLKGSMSGTDMSVEELGMIASFVDQAVKMAFAEVIAMADMLGQESVPVVVLKALSQQQSIATKMLWDTADFLDVNLTADTPDDLSELLDG